MNERSEYRVPSTASLERLTYEEIASARLIHMAGRAQKAVSIKHNDYHHATFSNNCTSSTVASAGSYSP